jgi:hypothetical protein
MLNPLKSNGFWPFEGFHRLNPQAGLSRVYRAFSAHFRQFFATDPDDHPNDRRDDKRRRHRTDARQQG